MKQGLIHIYSGSGHGKSLAALGKAVLAAAAGDRVVIIQFLKGKGISDSEFFSRMEPEIKIFGFEKTDDNYNQLSEEKKEEEIKNIKNGLNFAKKVLTTGECNLLILDEVLGIIDNGIITVEELKNILDVRDQETSIILTGISLKDDACMLADEVSKTEKLKFKCW